MGEKERGKEKDIERWNKKIGVSFRHQEGENIYGRKKEDWLVQSMRWGGRRQCGQGGKNWKGENENEYEIKRWGKQNLRWERKLSGERSEGYVKGREQGGIVKVEGEE